ncbi:UDP-N-acetylmuramoyl-L-alanyl-D-glutamate--2,6-diaminopimelate ligase [Alteribacillus sp. HJP-4]|uniref:UDP-N-acetylmuramoyl-L-alanyl-D-glutamate--2, 6-diaminopimelate ligase n=1 Tax=Alteribacillus sp. HJP-4 TaxID=2775394 RepID=UPI0035CD0A06
MKKLSEILKKLGPFHIPLEKDLVITSVHMDSREVTKGGLFFCTKGYTVDSHDFAAQAEKQGAAAIVAERDVDVTIPVIKVKDSKRAMAILANEFYDHPTQKFRLIGITGTNGKTTISHLIETILQKQRLTTGMIGTMYTKIGGKTEETKNTTPESLLLQRLFAQMAEESVDACIMEVSSHALDLGRVRGCDFNTAVFTNLSKDHLDYHQTMEEYKRAKGLLFSQLGNAYDSKGKTAVLNADDEASSFYEKICSQPILTYGINKKADIQATDIVAGPDGTEFILQTPAGSEKIHMAMVGRFSVYNALAAAAACLAEEVPLKVIVEALEEIKGVDGRFEPVRNGQSFAVIVDYAHTPDSLENALQTINDIAQRNVYVVIGCGGDRDKTKRPEMAAAAVKYSTHAVFTSDNPRMEIPAVILDEMQAGVNNNDSYTVIEDRREAILYAIQLAEKDDIVLIAGKGHETYQIIGKEVFPFDDRKEAFHAIEKARKAKE